MKSARSFFRPLRLPGFKTVAGAYSVNEVGNWLGEVALTILVYDQTGDVFATAALFLAMEFAPALVGPAVTARAELSGSRAALPVIFGVQSIAYFALAALAEDFVLPAILLIAALDGTLGIAGRSLARAAAAQILKPRDLLRSGNALLNLSYTIACAAGPAAAGLIVAGWSVRAALLINAVSFILAALLFALDRAVPNIKSDQESWYLHLREGVVYVRRHAVLGRLMLVMVIACVFLSISAPVEIFLVKDVLGAGDAGYGLLLTAWGIGMVVGGVLFAAASRFSIVSIWLVGTATEAVAFGGFAAANSLVTVCAIGAIGGIGNGIQWPAAISAVQAFSSAEFQARSVSFLSSIVALAPGIGFLLGGLVASSLSPRLAFSIAACGLLMAVLAGTFVLRDARQMRGQDVES